MIHKTKLKVVMSKKHNELFITYEDATVYNLSNSMKIYFINKSLNVNLKRGKYLLSASVKPFKNSEKISCALYGGYTFRDSKANLFLPCVNALNKLLHTDLESTCDKFTFYYKLDKI